MIVAPVVAAAVGLTGCSFTPSLDPRPLDPSASSRILAADGSLLARIDLGEHREPISLARMAPSLPAAVVAIEDRRFFQHDGVDYRAIVRAFSEDVRAGAVVQGGSTITQQYIRNVLLTNDRTVRRKVREAVLAIELERRYSKQQILERYLNAVYFGNGSYGAQVAAQRYFGTDAARLRLDQSALLAGLLRAPSTYDPYRQPGLALRRRNAVLDAMAKYGAASPAAAAAAKRRPLGVQPQTPDRVVNPYFVERVRDWFLANPAFGANEAQRARLLDQGGLRITTTLDLRLQRAAEAAVATVLSDRARDPAAALVAIEPATGRVVAYVGGRGYDGPEAWARYDLAGVAARPTGSTFKPFVLASALERRIPLAKNYAAPAAITLRPANAPAWTLRNYDNEAFAGRLDLLEATVNSVNTVYAQLMLDVGPEYATSLARRMGITTPQLAVPSAVLGTNSARVLDMADAYATFAADGVRTAPVLVTRVVDANGTVLWDDQPRRTRAIDSGIARTVNQVLQQVVTRGTGVRARIGRPVAGKTGTGEGDKDAWFVGSVPQLTAAVWVGFADRPRPMLPPTTRIKVTGGSWPADIWARFMSEATADLPIADFPTAPAGADAGVLPRAPLPAVVGMPYAQAATLLVDAGYAVERAEVPSAQYPPNTVLQQSPAARVAVRAGTVVTLTVATDAPATISVPPLLGLARADAEAEAAARSVKLDIRVAPEPPPGDPRRRGRVWKQSIASGVRAPRGVSMTVWVNPA